MNSINKWTITRIFLTLEENYLAEHQRIINTGTHIMPQVCSLNGIGIMCEFCDGFNGELVAGL
jgi:hypothetical protein